jgi:hypothetical protein
VTYRDLLTKAIREPEQLTPDDLARILPDDRAYIVSQLRRHVAAAEAVLAGYETRPRTVSDRRADDLVRLARKGALNYFALPDDEQQAIENTPGLVDRLARVWFHD